MLWLVLYAQVTTAAGSRPPECGALDGGKAANVWERAKAPELRVYCDLLASGASKLAGVQGSPRDVLAIADEADKKFPGKLAASVLRGRAYERLRKWDEAFATLSAVRAKDATSLEDAPALLAWARASVRTNHGKEAGDAYTALLPRASALSAAERGPAYVEAGFVAMSRGQRGIDEAVAIFRQARKDAQDSAQTVSWLALALALDRAGSHDEARAVLGERAKLDVKGALADARSRDVIAASFAPEADALLALYLEGTDLAGARDAYKRYIEAAGPSGTWTEHAKNAEGQLGKRRR